MALLWYADIVNFLVSGLLPLELTNQRRRKFIHDAKGHFEGIRTIAKFLQSDFYWPTMFKDAYEFCQPCDHCQRTGNLSRRYEIPMQTILEVKLFYI
ncbi:Retrovirus-related Pol polyprotein from transposon opus [Gossypium australe]|uniref:Retrovirus-related Pol polyprotein from transposon opus n=1 Tax=Gossypium australe TaxID=47621 RepID=A0A5B6VY33_9ROSI|nr:Retrovirus-related Pol polyprotein from transposon opus [Gossypium australe]